jgi:predicted nucleic acid binding AN1-type Zn finger protein
MKLWKQGIIILVIKKQNEIKTCSKCGNPVGMPFVCSHCHKIFCAKCRMPEAHNCENFNPKTATPLYKKI